MSVLSEARFHDEQAAYDWVEAHLWPEGPVCPHCGVIGRAYTLQGNNARIGLRKCGACRKKFTVKIGTIFEDSHLPMTKWLQAFYLMCSSKKGVSAHQLHRTLEVTYKTAWFVAHRIREAKKDGSLGPLGGSTSAVEADETFIGTKKGIKPTRGAHHKHAVLSLVERGGRVRSIHLDTLTKAEIGQLLRQNVARESWLFTDEAMHYREVEAEFAGHSRVHHALGEYVDPDDATINTQTVEGFFSIFKRGMKGIYQHCGEKHLHRYLAEFDFRHSNRVKLGLNDVARSEAALLGVKGKRLTYRRADQQAPN